MSDKPQIRTEIENALKNVDSETLKIIEQELDILDVTDALDGKSNLEMLYRLSKEESEAGNENAINSWTAYSLGMTTKKPDGDFLVTRRVFARDGFPDIDTDFDDERRGEVYEYVIGKYGRENVGNIGTYIAQKMKKSVKDSIRATDAAYAFHKGDKEFVTQNFELSKEISASLPVLPTGVIRVKDENGKDITIKSIKAAYQHLPDFKRYMDRYPEVYQHASEIEGLVGAFSQHAAGIVISNIPLNSIAPLRQNKKGLATQFVYEDLEALGLIKFDILAIAALTVIRDCCALTGENIDIENIPLNDEATLELYRRGDLNGVFQCESWGMQDTMRNIGVDRFDDVMAAIALYRPGPLDSIPEYVARKRGDRKVDYFHKSIKPYVKTYLEKTYGVLVYQEQVMQICNALAGFTITDGYVMIKAVGKKKQYLLDKFRNQFISGCVKNNVPQNIAEQYWDKFITPFANYGFNAAHCLAGDMRLKNKTTGQFYTIEELYKKQVMSDINVNTKQEKIVLDSYLNGEIVEDTLLDIFETGEKEVFEVQLDNGMVLKCTMEHKFYCADGKEHKLQDILDNNLEIIFRN